MARDREKRQEWIRRELREVQKVFGQKGNQLQTYRDCKCENGEFQEISEKLQLKWWFSYKN